MALRRSEKDAVVVGAGTAGAQAALQLALAGREVVLLDERPNAGGARWCNGIVPWQLERAGIAPPVPPELRAGDGALHMFAPSGRYGFTLTPNPVWEADMRLLGERLRSAAVAEGVEVLWDARHLAVRLEAGRPVEITVSCGDERVRLRAALFVDATGVRGALRSRVPSLQRWCPPLPAGDLCSAQQLVFELADRDGALRFLEDHGAEPGDSVGWLGTAGGFSAVTIRVDAAMEDVSVLTGTVAGGRYGSGPDMMRQVRERHGWIGRPLFGGAGMIPLRRPFDRIAAAGIALVGDAACQVLPAHGSGIGFGLIAGKVLAESVAAAPDPGSADALARYQCSFMRAYGGTLGFYDVVRRMSVTLGTEGVERMFEAGLTSPASSEPVLNQRLGGLGVRETIRQASTLASHRDLARVVAPALSRAALAPLLYRSYPRVPSEAALKAWSRLTRAALG